MTREVTRNVSASIRARLLSLAQSRGEDYQRVLGRYAIERFLYRLGRSEYRDNFALKGATLFTLWTGQTHRPTKDLDLLGRGLSSTITEVETIIRGICATPEDDGIVFDGELVEGARIKEDDEYDGARVKFQAKLSGVRIPMQVDIGFGDAIYPEPELTSFPVLLPMEAPLIRAYPREATIAEKFHAMVVLDIRNSRMKDFYDIWFMANTWEFEMDSLQKAIEFSFKRRGTPLPEDIPFALTDGFLDDTQRKCSGMPSSTAWTPTRRGQLSQRSVPFFAPSFCRAFRKNQNGNHACSGVQRIIGIEKDGFLAVFMRDLIHGLCILGKHEFGTRGRAVVPNPVFATVAIRTVC